MSGKHVSRYRMSQPTWGVFRVGCPGADWGLCNGHEFTSRKEARAWITKEEEGK